MERKIVIPIIILMLIVCPIAYATVTAFKLGSLGQSDLTGVKMGAVTLAAGNYMTFEYPVGTDFVVTAGKTFYITMISLSRGSVLIGYGDDGVAAGAAAPTNWVQVSGELRCTPSIEGHASIPVLIAIPAGKYPCAKENDGGVALLSIYGIEVTN